MHPLKGGIELCFGSFPVIFEQNEVVYSADKGSHKDYKGGQCRAIYIYKKDCRRQCGDDYGV
jgi:hypothetical protein